MIGPTPHFSTPGELTVEQSSEAINEINLDNSIVTDNNTTFGYLNAAKMQPQFQPNNINAIYNVHVLP